MIIMSRGQNILGTYDIIARPKCPIPFYHIKLTIYRAFMRLGLIDIGEEAVNSPTLEFYYQNKTIVSLAVYMQLLVLSTAAF